MGAVTPATAATSDNIAAIEKALEGVTHAPGPWENEGTSVYCDDKTGQRVASTEGDFLFWTSDQKRANATYIAACSPDRISALLAEARKAEAMQREIAEKDARIVALEAGVSDLVEIARQGVPSIPPDGPTSPEHQAVYEVTGFTLVEIRNRARTLLNGGSDAHD